MVLRPGPSGPQAEARFRERLVAAAARIGRPLSGEEAGALASHYRLLKEWGGKMNLTGLKDEETILRRHFLEPIAAADLLGEEGGLVDLGSGNGFPAIPLRVLHPGLGLTLVESSEKKSAFLWAVLRELGLRGAKVETRRVRNLADLADLLPCRYLSYRAVRGIEILKRNGRPILEPGGRALLFVAPEEAESIRARPIGGLRWVSTRPLPSGSRSVAVVLEPRS